MSIETRRTFGGAGAREQAERRSDTVHAHATTQAPDLSSVLPTSPSGRVDRPWRSGGARLLTLEKLLQREADVARDLPQKRRRDVAPCMKWDRRSATIGVTVLPVRSALSNLSESELHEDRGDLARLQDRQ
jgi:hypothetical protein